MSEPTAVRRTGSEHGAAPARARRGVGSSAGRALVGHAVLARVLEVRADLLPGPRRAPALGGGVRELLVPAGTGGGVHDPERHGRAAGGQPGRAAGTGAPGTSSTPRCPWWWSARCSRRCILPVFGALRLRARGAPSSPSWSPPCTFSSTGSSTSPPRCCAGSGASRSRRCSRPRAPLFFIVGASIVTIAGLGVTAVLAVLATKELVCGGDRLPRHPRRPRAAGGAPRRSHWRRLFKIGIQLAVAGVAVALLMRIPLAVLGNAADAPEVALFSAAQRFGDAVYILAISSGLRAAARHLLSRTRRPSARPPASSTGCCSLSSAPAWCSPPCLAAGRPHHATSSSARTTAAARTCCGSCYRAPGLRRAGRLLVRGGGLRRRDAPRGHRAARARRARAARRRADPLRGDTGAAWTYVGSLYAMAGLSLVVLERQLARGREPGAGQGRAGVSARARAASSRPVDRRSGRGSRHRPLACTR